MNGPTKVDGDWPERDVTLKDIEAELGAAIPDEEGIAPTRAPVGAEHGDSVATDE